MKLDGKVALITGAGTGIGTAIAERFVADGARICITGRRQEMLDKVAQSLPVGAAVTCAGDVTKFEDAQRMVETALGFAGKLDVLVNNAAIDPGGTTVVDIDPELWHRVLETNLTGPLYLMKASIPHMTFAHQPRQSQTFIVNVQTRQVLAVRTIMREGDVGKEPRAVHEFSPGVLGDPAIPPTGRKPAPTRDLIGLRGLYDYGPRQCFEHIYLNSERYAWQCIIGPLRGQADVDFSTIYKFDDNQYIFAFREFGLPVSTVFFYNWDQMRSTGKFFAIGDDGAIANTPAGALIKKLSVAFYPLDMQPI